MFDIICVLAIEPKWRDGCAIILFNFNEVQILNMNKDNISPVKKCFRKIHSQLPRGWEWSRVNTLNGAQREAHKMVAEMLK